MVNKEVISKVFDDAIVKCHITLKQRFEQFNAKDFKSERYSKKEGQIKDEYPSPIGRIQKAQEDLQDKVDYDNVDKSVLWDYQGSGFLSFSAWFYHTSKYLKHYTNEEFNSMKNIAERYPDSLTGREYNNYLKKKGTCR